ncbi:hypothetical protein U91I_02469 [alpha proteobacterium U9-1i]|nr:hypothetical protein U91I_02469 [alpha proteobacterium U9-1i]
MKPGAHIVLRAAARFYFPLVLLLALSVLATYPAGSGVGLAAGLLVALALLLHALVFGATAARAAFPASLARALMCLGVVGGCVAAGARGLPWSPLLLEGAMFAVVAAGATLALKVLAGRAPTLRDEDW